MTTDQERFILDYRRATPKERLELIADLVFDVRRSKLIDRVLEKRSRLPKQTRGMEQLLKRF
jgi:hypothetical protein